MARAATSELVVPLRKAWNITRFKRTSCNPNYPRRSHSSSQSSSRRGDLHRSFCQRENLGTWNWESSTKDSLDRDSSRWARYSNRSQIVWGGLIMGNIRPSFIKFERFVWLKNTVRSSLTTLITTRKWSKNSPMWVPRSCETGLLVT